MSEGGVGLGPRRNTSAQGESINAVRGHGPPGEVVYEGDSEDLTATPPRQAEVTTNQNLTLPSPQNIASQWMVAPESDMSRAEQDDSYGSLLYLDTVRQTTTAGDRISQGLSPMRLQYILQGTSTAESPSYSLILNTPVNTQARSEVPQVTPLPVPLPPSRGDIDSTMTHQAALAAPFTYNGKLATFSDYTRSCELIVHAEYWS